MVKANIIKVKVYPKDLQLIPDVLPFNKLICGEPVELELNKKEIMRCMNFADVFDMTTGQEVHIDEITVNDIKEFVEVEDEVKVEPTPLTPKSTPTTTTTTEDPENV